MSGFVAELHKLLTLRAVQGCAAAAIGCTGLLTWLNGRGVRAAHLSGDAAGSSPELIGAGELLVVVAMLAAIGVLAAGQEYRAMPEDLGGGRQASTSALAGPDVSRSLASKLGALAVFGSVVAVIASVTALWVADVALVELALPLTQERWAEQGRGALYAVLTALLGAVLTVLLRNGLVPMIYLVANSLVISVGYLLTQVTPLAWYLPDTAGMALLRPPDEQFQPSPLVGASVMIAWIVAFGVAALVLQRRRDT